MRASFRFGIQLSSFFFFFLKYRGVAGSYGGCHRMLTILQRNMLHQHHRWVSPPASLSNSKWVGFVFCVLFWFSVLWFFFGGLLRLKVKGFSFSRFVLCCVRFWFVSFEVWSMDPWAPMWSCWFFLLEFSRENSGWWENGIENSKGVMMMTITVSEG